jgi:hypothetical protein
MSRKIRIALTLTVGVLLILALRTVVAFLRFSRVEREFASVQNGQSRASVITKMGRPNYYAGKCGVVHFPDKNCATEYVYSHPFAPIIPEYYIVSFSSDDRVVEADQWDSP